MKLNLGCRLDIRDGYENIDTVPKDERVIKADARALSYPPLSIEEIIARDVLEHMLPEDVAPTIRHWFSLLMKGGRIHIRVPDILKQAQCLSSGVWDSRSFTYMVFAGSGEYERHSCGFTMDRLTGLLEGAGFSIQSTGYEHTNLNVDPLAAYSSNANIFVEAVKP